MRQPFDLPHVILWSQLSDQCNELNAAHLCWPGCVILQITNAHIHGQDCEIYRKSRVLWLPPVTESLGWHGGSCKAEELREDRWRELCDDSDKGPNIAKKRWEGVAIETINTERVSRKHTSPGDWASSGQADCGPRRNSQPRQLLFNWSEIPVARPVTRRSRWGRLIITLSTDLDL